MLKRLLFTITIVFVTAVNSRAQSSGWVACGASGPVACTTANVGVGTLSPTYPFTIDNTIAGNLAQIYNHSASGSGLDIVSAGTGVQQLLTARGGNGNTFSLTVLANGTVGINTLTPTTKLDVTYGPGPNGVRLVGDGSSYDKSLGITQILTDGSMSTPINAFYTNHSNNARANEFFRIHSGETLPAATAFRVTAGGTISTPTSSALTVSASGNVGVGTASPGFLFNVDGNVPGNMARFYNHNAAGAGFDIVSPATGNQDLLMLRSADGAKFVLDAKASGNIGLGTSAPSYPFHLLSSANGYLGAFATTDTGDGNTGRLLLQTGATQGAIELDVVNDLTSPGNAYAMIQTGKTTGASMRYVALDHRFLANGFDAMRISSIGSVAVGAAGLTVSGMQSTNTRFQQADNLATSGFFVVGSDYPTNGGYLILNRQNGAGSYGYVQVGDNNAYQGLALNPNGGNVAIGTTASTYKLEVNGNTHVNGDLVANRVIGAVYQDLAEWVPATEEIAPGTVVVLDARRNNHVVASSRAYDTTVAGVVSSNPGIILGKEGSDKVTVATTGRVHVRVDASKHPIAIGDLLVTSDKAGTAMYSQPIEIASVKIHRPGTIIGKALEPFESGTGEILVLLSLQ